MPGHLILASASPRRVQLLAQVGVIPVDIAAAEIDEAPQSGELPIQTAARLGRAKAQAIAIKFPDDFVLGADTVVACGRRLLNKPVDAVEARRYLELLSGRRHRVHGAICVSAPGGRAHERLVTTQVSFKRLTGAEIDAYIASGEWEGKAGGYAIQGRAEGFVKGINGSYSNVVGLALFETLALLDGLGVTSPSERGARQNEGQRVAHDS